MPVTFHSDKDAVVEHCWQKLKELGADQALVAFVSFHCMNNCPPESDVDAYERWLKTSSNSPGVKDLSGL
jgi:hypothetical protein